jgi:hypothetical protein
MGIYKKETIDKNFKTASKDVLNPAIGLLTIDAKIILETVPDNEARDKAISYIMIYEKEKI